MLKLRKYALCLLLFTLLISFASGSSAQVHTRLVCGKVVLNPTLAFARTVVMLSFGNESLLPGAVTEEDGTFCVEDHVNDLADKTAARLYASSFCRLDDVTLVEAPFWPYLRRRNMYSGENVVIGPGARTTVGNVDVQIIYGHVTLRILDERLSPLLKGASEWSPVWLRVRDEKGVVVHEAGLSMTDIERSVDLKNSLINLALPQGMWSLEVSLAGVPPRGESIGRRVSWRQVPRKLRIESCQKPTEVNLSVRRKLRSPKPTSDSPCLHQTGRNFQ